MQAQGRCLGHPLSWRGGVGQRVGVAQWLPRYLLLLRTLLPAQPLLPPLLVQSLLQALEVLQVLR